MNFLMQSRNSATRFLLALGAVAISWLAWHEGGSTAWLVALPFLWAASTTRLQAFGVWLGYYLTGARDVPAIFVVFFPDTWMGWGVLVWIIHAALLALPWALLWTHASTPGRAALASAIALTISALPPLGILGWLSPLLLAGEAYPVTGWLGLGLTLCLLSLVAALARTKDRRLLAALVVFAIASIAARAMETHATPPPGWVAINTTLGRHPSDIRDAYRHHQTLITATEAEIRAGARLIVLPEEAAGLWRAGTQFWWRGTEQLAREQGATILLGADLPDEGERFIDGAIILGHQQGSAPEIHGRVPMPIGVWRPGTGTGGIPDFLGNGTATIRGIRTAVSVCYEDFLIYPLLLAITDSPRVVISLANNWFARDMVATWIQHRSIENQARLFGVPLVRALNLGPPTQPGMY